jgi:hypothetical protein
MPEKNIQSSTITIGFSSIVSIITVFISAYIAVFLKNIALKFKRIDEKLEELKEQQKECKHIHGEFDDRMADVETIQAVINTKLGDETWQPKKKEKK